MAEATDIMPPTRRGVLFYGSAAVAAAVLAGSTTPAIADPVHALIEQYYAGLTAYTDQLADGSSIETDDRLADATYRPAYDRLSAPLPAITTKEGAKAALTLIREENGFWANSPVIPHLTDALMAWVIEGLS